MTLVAGVVAVQGDVAEHSDAIKRAAASHNEQASVHEVRETGVIPDCDVLLVPGGESTTISRLLERKGIDDEIRAHAMAEKPILATCAGLIVSSRNTNDRRVSSLDLLDVSVTRNAFGSQRDSFEAPLDVTGLEDPFPAVFIRAPVIDDVGMAVDVLASWDGQPVAVRQGSVLGTAFHPELTGDSRIHDLAFFKSAVHA